MAKEEQTKRESAEKLEQILSKKMKDEMSKREIAEKKLSDAEKKLNEAKQEA